MAIIKRGGDGACISLNGTSPRFEITKSSRSWKKITILISVLQILGGRTYCYPNIAHPEKENPFLSQFSRSWKKDQFLSRSSRSWKKTIPTDLGKQTHSYTRLPDPGKKTHSYPDLPDHEKNTNSSRSWKTNSFLYQTSKSWKKYPFIIRFSRFRKKYLFLSFSFISLVHENDHNKEEGGEVGPVFL